MFITKLNKRNIVNNNDGTLTMEVDHPVNSWTLYTVLSTDDWDQTLDQKREGASLTRREFFQALITAGLYDQVKALETDPVVPLDVRVDLIEATSFDRMYPSLVSMASSMGITDAQLDSIFGII